MNVNKNAYDIIRDTMAPSDLLSVAELSTHITGLDGNRKKEYISNLKILIELFLMEFLNIETLDSAIRNIWNPLYRTNYTIITRAIFPYKEKFLKKLYNICTYAGDATHPDAYSDIKNVSDEVMRIFRDVYGSEEIISDIFPLLTSETNINDTVGSEFININGVVPLFISGQYVGYYSALLNYSELDMDLSISGKSTKTIVRELSAMTNSSFDKFFTDWDQRREKFIKFLDQLSLRTINY